MKRKYSRRGGGERGHPGLEEPPPELEGVLADKDKINQLHDSELIKKDSGDDGDDEERQLGHDQRELGHAQDLGADHAADADGRDPGRRKNTFLDPFVPKGSNIGTLGSDAGRGQAR